MLTYNYARAGELIKAGKMFTAKHPGASAAARSMKGEMPGLSVFLRDGDRIFHTYSTYQRGLDLFLNMYNLLDVTPLGRQEEEDQGMGGGATTTNTRPRFPQAKVIA